jgi:hypothetical protein
MASAQCHQKNRPIHILSYFLCGAGFLGIPPRTCHSSITMTGGEDLSYTRHLAYFSRPGGVF